MKTLITETKADSPLTRRLGHPALALFVIAACLGPDQLPADTIVTSTPPLAIRQTLSLFLDLARRDSALAFLLAKHKLLLQYSICDLGLDCYVGTEGRAIVADFGLPARKAELVFVSDAGTLHHLLRDADSEADAQMAVHLGIVRKLKLAKDLKPIRAALARLYNDACKKIDEESSRPTRDSKPVILGTTPGANPPA